MRSLMLGMCGLLASLPFIPRTSGQTSESRADVARNQESNRTSPYSNLQKSGNKQPAKFDFTVVSAEQEEALPESTRVEGLTKDDTRFILSCPLGLPRRTPAEIASLQKETRLASQDAKLPTLSIFSTSNVGGTATTAKGDSSVLDAASSPFLVCMIINRVAHAKNVFTVRVLSSQPTTSKGTRGFQVDVNGTDGSFKLGCTQGGGAGKLCVPVKAGTYRAIRDGTDFRVCDADLSTVGRFKILSESPSA